MGTLPGRKLVGVVMADKREHERRERLEMEERMEREKREENEAMQRKLDKVTHLSIVLIALSIGLLFG